MTDPKALLIATNVALFLVFLPLWVGVLSLMWAESWGPNSTAPPPWERQQFLGFLWGDLCLTVFAGIAAYHIAKLEGPAVFDRWFFQPAWIIPLAFFGTLVSLWLEVGAVKSGFYSMSQELSPSKLWHTLIFGPMLCVIVTLIIASLTAIWTGTSGWKAIGLTISIMAPLVLYAYLNYLDVVNPAKPWDAHVEGNWARWDWHLRPKA